MNFIWKKGFWLLLAALLLFAAPGGALADEKTLTVDSGAAEETGKIYGTIQAAIDYIAAQPDSVGYTIRVGSGAYAPFTVPAGVGDLTIEGSGASVVDTSRGTVELVGGSVTLKSLTFASADTGWSTPSIRDYSGNAGLLSQTAVSIQGCSFRGSNAGYALHLSRGSISVSDCVFSGYTSAIELISDVSSALRPDGTITISGNAVSNCDFFLHYGVDAGKSLVVMNNQVSGTETQVCASLFAWAGDSLSVRGNTFQYAAFGLQNAANGEALARKILAENTFIDSYTAADYYDYSTGKDYSVTYFAPETEGARPLWSVNPDAALAEKFRTALTGHENDNPLRFATSDGAGDLVSMGLSYHALNLRMERDVPATGDGERPLLWLALGALALAGLALTLRRPRRT